MTLLLIKIHSETNIFLSSKGIWEREKRGLISYLLAWDNDQLLCLKILHSRKNEICLWKIGNERRDVLGDSRKRYHRPWTEIGKYWPRKEPIRLDLSFLYVSTTSVDTFLLIRLWQQSNSIHRSKASVLVQKLAQFKCFEHVVERKLSGYKGNIIPFHLHGCCSCYPATRYYTSRSYTGRNYNSVRL